MPLAPCRSRHPASSGDPHGQVQRLALERWIGDRLPLDRAATGTPDPRRSAIVEALLGGEASARRPAGLLLLCRERLLAAPSLLPLAGNGGRVAMLLGRERQRGYERALTSLPASLRDLVILRIEFGLDPPAIAIELRQPEQATRKATLAALAALAMALLPPNRRAA